MVQRADIACSAHRDVITFILSNDDVEVSADRFAKYQAEYEVKYVAFEQAKTDLQNKYLKGIAAKSWNLDYTTRELTYSVWAK